MNTNKLNKIGIEDVLYVKYWVSEPETNIFFCGILFCNYFNLKIRIY
jgi:hypothetical protein